MQPQQFPSSLGPGRVMLNVKPSQRLPSSPAPRRVTLKVKLPMSEDRIPVEMAENDTVLKLKEKMVALEGMEGVTVDMIVLCPRLLRRGGWSPNMDVFLKWSGSVSQGSSRAFGYRYVGLSWINTPADLENRRQYWLKVNTVDNVSWVLRNYIADWEENSQFRLAPHCAYYFLYKQQVMNEQESFDWHGVRDGDTIRVFFGYVLIHYHFFVLMKIMVSTIFKYNFVNTSTSALETLDGFVSAQSS